MTISGSGTADTGNLTVLQPPLVLISRLMVLKPLLSQLLAKRIDIDGDDLETITVAGAGDISIDVDASVTTFTSTASGDVTMIATAAADVTATGGDGLKPLISLPSSLLTTPSMVAGVPIRWELPVLAVQSSLMMQMSPTLKLSKSPPVERTPSMHRLCLSTTSPQLLLRTLTRSR